MLVSRNWNCSGMMASNRSGYALHQCSVLTVIEEWVFVYWEVCKGKVVSECELSEIL